MKGWFFFLLFILNWHSGKAQQVSRAGNLKQMRAAQDYEHSCRLDELESPTGSFTAKFSPLTLVFDRPPNRLYLQMISLESGRYLRVKFEQEAKALQAWCLSARARLSFQLIESENISLDGAGDLHCSSRSERNGLHFYRGDGWFTLPDDKAKDLAGTRIENIQLIFPDGQFLHYKLPSALPDPVPSQFTGNPRYYFQYFLPCHP